MNLLQIFLNKNIFIYLEMYLKIFDCIKKIDKLLNLYLKNIIVFNV